MEIIEKAHSKFKEQFDKIKENITLSSAKETPQQQAPMDNILRPGDMFRLRSVKFPDFELGLTSVKVRDEYCYLGLRKMVSPLVVWCKESRIMLCSCVSDLLLYRMTVRWTPVMMIHGRWK